MCVCVCVTVGPQHLLSVQRRRRDATRRYARKKEKESEQRRLCPCYFPSGTGTVVRKRGNEEGKKKEKGGSEEGGEGERGRRSRRGAQQDNRVALTNILHLLLLHGQGVGGIRESAEQMPWP